MSYAVGQTLWFESHVRYKSSGYVTITKVGRIYLTFDTNNRADKITLIQQSDNSSHIGQYYLTKEACEAEQATRAAWNKLRDLMQYCRPPSSITAEAIATAQQLLFPGDSHA